MLYKQSSAVSCECNAGEPMLSEAQLSEMLRQFALTEPRVQELLRQTCSRGLEMRQTATRAEVGQGWQSAPIPVDMQDGVRPVSPVGRFFALQGMGAPAQSLARILRSQVWAWSQVSAGELRRTLQVTRIVSAAGMGKVCHFPQSVQGPA